MEIILSPSILSADFANLGEMVVQTKKAGAEWLHIDVMDGIFVPNISFGFPVIEAIKGYADIVFDVHLMITKPERYIERFIKSGADVLTFHAEATNDIGGCIDIIKSYGVKAGLAISPKTPYNAVLPYIDRLDMVLCMTVEPGYGGQKYIKEMENKIKAVRDYVGNDFLIQIDGGITAENIIEPIKAGANVIVAGSAVYNGNIYDNIMELKSRCEQL